MKAIWQKPGIKAEVITRGNQGVGRLLIKDQVVFETSGGDQGIGIEWDTERQAIADLAVLIAGEVYERGETDFYHFLCLGSNTAEIENPPRLLSEDIEFVYDSEGQGYLF